MRNSGLLCILAAALFVFGSTAQADTTYYGELCWKATVSGDEDINIIKLAVSDMGDNHIFFNGRSVSADSGSSPELFSGSGEIAGGNVVMMLDNVFNGQNEFGSGKFYVTISLINLSGTFTGMLQVFDKQLEESETIVMSGTFIYQASCP